MFTPSHTAKHGSARQLRFDRLEDRLALALMLDIGFDGDGTLTTDFGFGNDSAQAVGFQSDNRIVVGGIVWNGASEDFGLARYLADGSLDRTFVIDLDLPGLGANPMRRDLFVEVDAMVTRAPLPGVIDAVIQSFANAPVGNADGSSGIHLHVTFKQLEEPPNPNDPLAVATGDFDGDGLLTQRVQL